MFHIDIRNVFSVMQLQGRSQQKNSLMVCLPHTMSRKQATTSSSSKFLTSEVLDVTTSETNQPVNSSDDHDDESTRMDGITTTQCKHSPAEDVIGTTKHAEKASAAVKHASQVAKEEKQHSSENDPMKAGGGHSNSSAKSNNAGSSTTGKAVAAKTVRHKGGKVIIDFRGTIYFISWKRCKLLLKQWYVLIQCLSETDWHWNV